MRPVVVELCGLPGSGKTTVAEHTRAALAAQGLPCAIADAGISARAPRSARVLRRGTGAVLQGVRHPVRSGRAARTFAALGQPGPRDTVAGTIQWLATQDLIRRAHASAGVRLFEEGLTQTLWTLALRADRQVPQPDWAAWTPEERPHLVVFLDVPVEVALGRLSTRTSRHSRTQRLPEEQRLPELRRGRALMELVLAGWPASSVRRLRLDEQTPAADVADVVVQQVAAAGSLSGNMRREGSR